MKWIGQHIWDFISRFRGDVYFEAVPDGTIASGKNLGLDSNNKLVKESDTGVTDLHGAGVNGAANQLLTDDGDGTVTSEANFKFEGDTATVSSSTSMKPEFVLKSTTNDNKGSYFNFVSDKGGPGADSDGIGHVTFTGDNSAQEQVDFCRISGRVNTALDTDEAGKFEFRVAASDGNLSALRTGLELIGHSTDNEVDVNIGYGSTSSTTLTGTLTMGSTLFANNSGVIQVATQGTIDHDSLANSSGNKHIDWTAASAGTVNSTNIPTLNQNTTGSSASCTGNAATADALTSGNKTITGGLTVTTEFSSPRRKFVRTDSSAHFEVEGDVLYFGSGSTTQGDLCYLKEDGSWGQAHASGAATGDDADRDAMGMLAIALGTDPDINGMLIRGIITMDYDLGDVGNPVYVKTVAGGMTHVAPSGSGDFVRVVGYCLSDDHGIMYFNPDNTWVEIA